MTGDKQLKEETMLAGPDNDPFQGYGQKKIIDREDEYHRGRIRRGLSAEREDAFKVPVGRPGPDKNDKGAAYAGVKRTYTDIREDQKLANETADVHR